MGAGSARSPGPGTAPSGGPRPSRIWSTSPTRASTCCPSPWACWRGSGGGRSSSSGWCSPSSSGSTCPSWATSCGPRKGPGCPRPWPPRSWVAARSPRRSGPSSTAPKPPRWMPSPVGTPPCPCCPRYWPRGPFPAWRRCPGPGPRPSCSPPSTSASTTWRMWPRASCWRGWRWRWHRRCPAGSALEDEGHRAVVDQLDLHVLLEETGFHAGVLGLQQVEEPAEQDPGRVRGHGLIEGGPPAPGDAAGQGELADGEDLAAHLLEAEVQLPVTVLEDPQRGDLGGGPGAGLLRIPDLQARQHEQAGPDGGFQLPAPHRGPLHALDDCLHRRPPSELCHKGAPSRGSCST